MTKTRQEHEYHGSEAEQKKPAAEMVAELKQAGRNDSEIAVILKDAGYNLPEMSGATGYNGKQLARLREGQPANKEGKEAVHGARRVKDDASGKERELSEDTPQDAPETRDAPPQTRQKFTPKTERGQTLLSVLETVTGLAPAKRDTAIKFYEAHQEDFDANPLRLVGILQGSGLSWLKAQGSVGEWLTQVDPDQVFSPYLGGGAAGGVGARGQEVPAWAMPYLQQAGVVTGAPKPLTFMEKMEQMQDKMIEARMMAGIMGEMGGFGAAAPRAPPTTPADDQRAMMNQMMMMSMMKSMNEPRNQGFGPGGMGMFMPAEYEPLLDDEGHVVKDETGNAIMRVRYNWPTGPVGGQAQSKATGEGEAMKYLVEAMKETSNSRADMAEKFASMVQTMSAQQFEMLQSRIAGLESSDPLDMVQSIMDRVKDWGVGGQEKNVEVAKMDNELKRWMHEQSMGLQKWIVEQKNAAKDKEYARQQLKEFGATMRTGIEKIGVPMAKAASEGFAGARGANGGGGNNGGAGRQAAARRAPAGEEDLTGMSDDAIIQLHEQATQTTRTVDDAKKKIVQEINRRGLNI